MSWFKSKDKEDQVERLYENIISTPRDVKRRVAAKLDRPQLVEVVGVLRLFFHKHEHPGEGEPTTQYLNHIDKFEDMLSICEAEIEARRVD